MNDTSSEMNVRAILVGLFEALILAGFAGAVGYGITDWLAPPSVSAGIVATIAAGIAALFTLAPTAILGAVRQHLERRSATPATYYDFSFDLTKEDERKN